MAIFLDVLKFVILVMMTFFTCQIITDNKKRISYIGTLLVCFSSACLEYINSGFLEAIISSELIFISINRLIENTKSKYFYLIGIIVRNFRILDTFKY